MLLILGEPDRDSEQPDVPEWVNEPERYHGPLSA